MDALRYFVALLLVVTLPPLFFYWLLIHPLIALWRRKGMGVTYGLILTIIVTGMIGLFSMRHYLLTIDFGSNYFLAGLGLFCLLIAGLMWFAIERRLPIRVLLGVSEIAPERYSRRLITEGIYARIRHPRYAELVSGFIGCALVANYLASYLAVLLWIPGTYVIVLLEEKELRAYFGADYEKYCRNVPRFLPKLRC
jgi:protein-S-isoprenylcysteine O-methyltransferase Ste14